MMLPIFAKESLPQIHEGYLLRLFSKQLRMLLLGIACCSGATPAQTKETLPGADELVRKFVARMRQEEKQKPDQHYSFTEHRIHDELDKAGTIKEHSDREYQMVSVNGKPYLRWVAKNGRPLAGDDVKQQQEDERKFLDEKNNKKKASDDGVKLDDRFVGNFHFEVVGRETINGRPAFVVTVLPKSKNLPARSNSEKLFTHMQGKVWVDAQDFGLAKVDMHLTEPTSFYGFLGSVRQLDLELRQIVLDNSVWLPQSIQISVDARKLMTSTHVRQSSQYRDFKPLSN